MIDDQYRDLFRAGLAPLVEDVPEGPDWDELTDGEIVNAVPADRRIPGWLVGVGAAAVVLVVIGVAALVVPGGPPETTTPAATTPPTSEAFDVDTAASQVEAWWSLVINGDLTAAADMAHPEGDFNFAGLTGLVSGLGSDVTASAERDVFGTEDLPMLCYTLDGSGGDETGAAVFREHDQTWMLWEIRPNTVGCFDTTTTTTSATTTTLLASEAWDLIADHPVVGRTFPVVVWTGTEVVVWGGEKPSEGAWHADGAAFNPITGTWRDLADSPLSPRSEHAAVWTGEEILICCGRIVGGGVPAAAYNPEADEWREIASPGFSPAFAEAVWTGEEMLVFGGVGGRGTSNLVGAAAYNPLTDSWRRLADLPYGLERVADSTLGDGVVYAWPSFIHFTVDRDDRPPLAYDLAADEWQQLPPLPDGAPSSPSLVWTGDRLFAYGAGSDAEGDAIGISMTYDPVDQTWRFVPQSPLETVSSSEGTEASQKAVWGDGEVYIWTGWVGTDWEEPITRVVSYDPAVDSWRELEPAPVPAQGLWHAPIIWTGSQLITYTDPMLIYTP